MAHNSALQKPRYSQIAAVVSYDPDTGEFTRIALVKHNKGVKLGPIRIVRGSTFLFFGYSLTYNQLAWLLMKKEFPKTRLTHRDKDQFNFKWENITGVGCQNKNIKSSVIIEVINGKKMEVECASPRQPKSESSTKRQNGECQGCGTYIVCLDNEFKGKCLGKTKAPEKRLGLSFEREPTNLYKGPDYV
jgi:hypothetical protein